MTNKPDSLDKSVIKSSVMPSTKYSCAGSSDMLVKGSTAMDGLSGKGKAIFSTDAGSVSGSHSRQTVSPAAAMTTTAAAAMANPRQRLLMLSFVTAVAPANFETRTGTSR